MSGSDRLPWDRVPDALGAGTPNGTVDDQSHRDLAACGRRPPLVGQGCRREVFRIDGITRLRREKREEQREKMVVGEGFEPS